MPLRVSAQDTTEFEFHISPVWNSSRPHTGVGISSRTSSTRRAQTSELDTRTGLPIAAPDVGDLTVTPASHFVPEDSEPTRESSANGALRDDAA